MHDPRHLWPHVARIVGDCEPPFVFLENVAHHLRLGFPEVAGELVGMGYSLAAGLFTAAEVGAPHRRERLFVLARRERDDMADPARLLGDPVERREPDGAAAALAETGERPVRVRTRSARAGTRNLRARRRMWMTPTARDHKDGATSLANTPVNGLLGRQVLTTPPAGRRYLRCAPDLEPAVRRGADGLAHRVDRLRLCGNGVVPLVAAHALRTLAAELLADG